MSESIPPKPVWSIENAGVGGIVGEIAFLSQASPSGVMVPLRRGDCDHSSNISSAETFRSIPKECWGGRFHRSLVLPLDLFPLFPVAAPSFMGFWGGAFSLIVVMLIGASRLFRRWWVALVGLILGSPPPPSSQYRLAPMVWLIGFP
ncbi:MAG: hypothetical protein R3F11_03360 [Verrucomicrobiales bacterium]